MGYYNEYGTGEYSDHQGYSNYDDPNEDYGKKKKKKLPSFGNNTYGWGGSNYIQSSRGGGGGIMKGDPLRMARSVVNRRGE